MQDGRFDTPLLNCKQHINKLFIVSTGSDQRRLYTTMSDTERSAKHQKTGNHSYTSNTTAPTAILPVENSNTIVSTTSMGTILEKVVPCAAPLCAFFCPQMLFNMRKVSKQWKTVVDGYMAARRDKLWNSLPLSISEEHQNPKRMSRLTVRAGWSEAYLTMDSFSREALTFMESMVDKLQPPVDMARDVAALRTSISGQTNTTSRGTEQPVRPENVPRNEIEDSWRINCSQGNVCETSTWHHLQKALWSWMVPSDMDWEVLERFLRTQIGILLQKPGSQWSISSGHTTWCNIRQAGQCQVGQKWALLLEDLTQTEESGRRRLEVSFWRKETLPSVP